MTLQDYLLDPDLPLGRACEEAREWIGDREDIEALVAECPRGDWLLWIAERAGINAGVLQAAVRPAVLRAARIYAADAVEAAGRDAGELRGLADDATFEEIETAVRTAVDAEAAARAAAMAAAVGATWADAAAADAAAWAAAAAAADAAAVGATWADAAAVEHALCAVDVRHQIPDLAARIKRAMKNNR